MFLKGGFARHLTRLWNAHLARQPGASSARTSGRGAHEPSIGKEVET